MSFHDVRFPTGISFGSSGGPERRTEIVTLGSGREERNTPWAQGRRRYEAGLGLSTLDELHAVIAFFEARRGRLHGFRWKDHVDFQSCGPLGVVGAMDQVLGVGDGVRTAFALVKAYGDAGGGLGWRGAVAAGCAGGAGQSALWCGGVAGGDGVSGGGAFCPAPFRPVGHLPPSGEGPGSE